MITCLSSVLNKVSEDINPESSYWSGRLNKEMGISADFNDKFILRQIYRILSVMPIRLIKNCGINKIHIRNDMGPCKPYYPNHGYFIDNSVTLNSDIFYNPDSPSDFMDYKGYFVTRPEQTLLHEFAHGYDEIHDFLSAKKDWLSLSGWSEKYFPGLKRLVINDKGAPEVKGEWFYDPTAEFTRFYAKKNPWDDWADSFAFYVSGLKNKVPSKKSDYLKSLLSSYYS